MKPFFETGLGKFLAGAAPEALKILGDSGLPVVSQVAKIVNAEAFTPEQKQEYHTLLSQYEAELPLLLADTKDARATEVAIVNVTKKKDLLLSALAIFGVAAPCILVGYLIFSGIKVEPLVAGFIGVIIGSYPQVYNYVFGSSAGSKAKDDTITSLSK